MAEVFPPYHVFINHRGPDVKKTLASLIYYSLVEPYGLRVFLDKEELEVGDSLTPAFQSAIRSASVHIAIFSKTYAQSAWCLNELLWMFECDPTSTKIIPIFYDIEPSDLRYVEKGAYARAFKDHKSKDRFRTEVVESWIKALEKVSAISGVVFETDKDDHGKHLKEIREIVLKKVGRVQLHVCEHPVGLLQAAEHFEKEALSPSELTDTHAVGIVGLGGSGKSTLATHLYNSKYSHFQRSCFLHDVSKDDLPSLQQTLLRELTRDQNLRIENTRRGRSLLQDRLRGLPRVLIVFDDIDNREQIENLLFVKDVVGNGSLILLTCRDESLLVSSKIKLYRVKLLNEKHAQELFCLHAFGDNKSLHDLQYMVEELVRMCGGFPLALKVLAGQLYNERDPRKWKKQLESLRKQLPENKLRQIVKDSYDSLDVREQEAFLDIAYFFTGEDTDLVERVLDGLNDDLGFQCIQTLRHKCLVELESADIMCRRAFSAAGETWSTGVWRRAKGSSKIRMHDLVRDLARQIGREKLPLRLRWPVDIKYWSPDTSLKEVRGIRTDEDQQLPVFVLHKDTCGLRLLAVQNSPNLYNFNRVSGDLTWLRLSNFQDTLNLSLFRRHSLSDVIPSTLLLRSLRVLEVHGVSPQHFCNFFGDRELPSQLRALEITHTIDFGSVSTAGPSTTVSGKHSSAKQGSASETSDSLQPPVNFRQWFQAWLGKLNLKNLVKTVLQNIGGLKSLPIKFEEVRNLRHVDLSGCSDLEVLPDSFTEELLELQYLALRDCRKLVLRDLGNISKLEYLDFEGCSMLEEMPKGTEDQKSLKYLNVLHTELRKLPQHLGQLEYLEELHIGSLEMTELPSSLYSLRRLTSLTLIECTKLLFIDNSIKKLVLLESLRIYNCGVRALPERIAWMKMKILDVQGCPLDSEQLLIGVDSGNMPLDNFQAQGSIDQSAHPKRSSCLTDLIIRKCSILKIDIPQAGSIFPMLQFADLSENRLLTEIGSLPSSLIGLKLMYCSKLRTLACVSNLARLKYLDISGCVELEKLNVEGLSSVEVIKINCLWTLPNIEGLNLLEKLSHFQISWVYYSTPLNMLWKLTAIEDQHPRIRCYDFISALFHSKRVTVLKGLDIDTQASVEIKESYFTKEKLEGAILLCFVTSRNSRVEVAFLGRIYTTYCSAFDGGSPIHILMWTKESEVFNDFKFSKDEVIRFDIKVLNSKVQMGLLNGWIVEAKNGFDMTAFLSTTFQEYESQI